MCNEHILNRILVVKLTIINIMLILIPTGCMKIANNANPEDIPIADPRHAANERPEDIPTA